MDSKLSKQWKIKNLSISKLDKGPTLHPNHVERLRFRKQNENRWSYLSPSEFFYVLVCCLQNWRANKSMYRHGASVPIHKDSHQADGTEDTNHWTQCPPPRPSWSVSPVDTRRTPDIETDNDSSPSRGGLCLCSPSRISPPHLVFHSLILNRRQDHLLLLL